MKISSCSCVLLLAAAALCIQAVTNEADLADMSELDSQAGGPMDLAENPTKAECATVSRSLPAICTVLGEKSCAAFRSKHNAKCGAFNMEDDNEEDNEDIGEDDDQDMSNHGFNSQRPVAANDQHDEGSKRGSVANGLMTTGSFVMMIARNGPMEEELGDDDEAEVEEWDLSNSGKCDEHEEAWVQTDASDKTMGKCIQYAADTKCGIQCFHQGKSATEEEEQAICSKICRVPGHGGAKCNVMKTVQPMKEESTELGEGKTMYLTRSKVTQADRNAKADPMACAGIRQE